MGHGGEKSENAVIKPITELHIGLMLIFSDFSTPFTIQDGQ